MMHSSTAIFIKMINEQWLIPSYPPSPLLWCVYCQSLLAMWQEKIKLWVHCCWFLATGWKKGEWMLCLKVTFHPIEVETKDMWLHFLNWSSRRILWCWDQWSSCWSALPNHSKITSECVKHVTPLFELFGTKNILSHPFVKSLLQSKKS